MEGPSLIDFKERERDREKRREREAREMNKFIYVSQISSVVWVSCPKSLILQCYNAGTSYTLHTHFWRIGTEANRKAAKWDEPRAEACEMQHGPLSCVMLRANTPCLNLRFANRWDTAPVIKQAYFHPTAITWFQQTCWPSVANRHEGKEKICTHGMKIHTWKMII